MWNILSLRKLKQWLASGGRNKIISNFFSLSVLQATNLLIPLVTVPYVIRTCGIERFGVLGMAMALVGYFELIADYGFDLSATKKISENRHNPLEAQKIFSSVTFLKIILSLSGLVVITAMVVFIPFLNEYKWIYLITFGRVLGKSLFPVWYYQGMEEMRYITIFNVSAKALFAVLTIVLVNHPDQFYLVPSFSSLGVILPGLYAQFHVRKKFKVSFTTPLKKELIADLRDGFYLFLSRVYVNLYNSFNVVVLGFLTNYSTVGQYTLAAKIIEAFSTVFIPANNALFPYLSRMWKESPPQFFELIRKLTYLFLAAGIGMALILFLIKEPVIRLVNGSPDSGVKLVLSILSLKLPLAALGPLFTSMFICQGRNRAYLWVVKNTFLFNLLLVPLGIYFFDGLGLAGTIIAVGIFHQYLFHLKRKEILPQPALLQIQ